MSDPITLIANWLESLLSGWGLSPLLIAIILNALGILVMATLLLVLDIFLVWVERKVVARFQDRLGPNRLGPFGLIQPLADIIKLLIKESILPVGADRIVYNLAPILSMAAVLLIWAVIPVAPTILGTDINVGVLYIVAVGALSALSIRTGGIASSPRQGSSSPVPPTRSRGWRVRTTGGNPRSAVSEEPIRGPGASEKCCRASSPSTRCCRPPYGTASRRASAKAPSSRGSGSP